MIKLYGKINFKKSLYQSQIQVEFKLEVRTRWGEAKEPPPSLVSFYDIHFRRPIQKELPTICD